MLQAAVHRGYLDQAIAFKRDQQGPGDGRPRGRRRSAAEQLQLERDNRQREAAFSVYFNGANNEDRGDNLSRRQSIARKESINLAVNASPASGAGEGEQRRRGWRRQSQEVTGKITEQPALSTTPTSFPIPHPSTELKEDPSTSLAFPSSVAVLSRDDVPSPFTTSPTSPASFVIGQGAFNPTIDSRRRRRTWARTAIEIKTEDGEIVHIQPRRIDWDVQDHEEERTSPPPVDGAGEQKEGGEDRKDEAQDTGEDTSAEVSYAGQSPAEEDEDKTQLPSIPPSPILSPSSSSSLPSPLLRPAAQHIIDSAPSPDPSAPIPAAPHVMERASVAPATPSLRPAPPLPSTRTRASLLPPSDPSPLPLPPPVPPRPQLPALSFRSSALDQVFPPAPAPVDASMSSRRRAAFGRRATAPAESAGSLGVSVDSGAPAQAVQRASTAWIIAVEPSPSLGGGSEQSGRGGEGVVVEQAPAARRDRRSRTLPPSAAVAPPMRSTTSAAAPTSASPDSSLSALHPTRPRPTPPAGKATPTPPSLPLVAGSDAEQVIDPNTTPMPSAPIAGSGRTAASSMAGPAVATPGLRRVSAHSLEELERSFDSLERLRVDILSSPTSTAAERKQQRQHSLNPQSSPAQPTLPLPSSPSPTLTASLPTPPEDSDSEDVDALIDDFLTSNGLSHAKSPSPLPALSVVSMPVLPVGRVLTFVFHSTYTPSSHLSLTRLHLFDDQGRAIPAATLSSVSSPVSSLPPSTLLSSPTRSRSAWSMPTSLSSRSATPPSLSVTFQSLRTLSLISIWNGDSDGDAEDGRRTHVMGQKETRSGVREVELRLDGQLLFRGPLCRSSSQPEHLLFTRDDALIGSLMRSQQRLPEEDSTERRRLAVVQRPATAVTRPISSQSTSTPPVAGSGPGGGWLQLIILPSRSSPAQWTLPGFRAFSASSPAPLLVHPPAQITSTVSRSVQPSQLPAAQCLSLPLSSALPLSGLQWDDAAQEVVAKDVGLQVLVDGRLVWAGQLGGGEGESMGYGLEMRWGHRRPGSESDRSKQGRVRIWKEGREVLASRG